MSLENILCPAQQIEAVMALLMVDGHDRIKDDVVSHALFSVMDNVGRMMEAIDECFKLDSMQAEILMELGVFEAFAKKYHDRLV